MGSSHPTILLRVDMCRAVWKKVCEGIIQGGVRGPRHRSQEKGQRVQVGFNGPLPPTIQFWTGPAHPQFWRLSAVTVLPPQTLQAPPKVRGHLGPGCQQLSQSLFGGLGEVEVAGNRSLFKGDTAVACRCVIALSTGGHHIVSWGQQTPVVSVPS